MLLSSSIFAGTGSSDSDPSKRIRSLFVQGQPPDADCLVIIEGRDGSKQ